MLKKLGELKINKSADYYDHVVKALEEAGYTIILEYENSYERDYIIAMKRDDD